MSPLPLIAVVVACWPSFVALHRLWVNWELSSYTHGYLTAALCIWLLWRDRGVIQGTPSVHAWWNVLPLLASGFTWILAVQAGVQFAELAILPFLLWSAVLAAFGWSVARKSAFPLALLNLATTLPTALNPLFQWTSVYAVRLALSAVGIPAIFEGNRVHIAEGTFEIADGCSGLNFVLVGLTIAFMMGVLRDDGLYSRLKLVLVGLVLAMLTNWVRIFTIILVGHYTHMQHFLVAESHYGFGWVVFALAMVIFFLLESRLGVGPPSEAPPQAAPRAAAGNGRLLAWQVAALAVLALFSVWRVLASRPSTVEFLPLGIPAEWAVRVPGQEVWKPSFVGVDEERSEILSRNEVTVYRYGGLYRSQKQGKEISGYYNDALGGLRQIEVVEPAAVGRGRTVVRARDTAGNESLIAITYSIDGNVVASALQGQLWYAARSLAALRSAASRVMILRIDCLPDCGSAANVLRELEEQVS